MEKTDHNQRVLVCTGCGTARCAYTNSEKEYCTQCGQPTTDDCPNCNLPLKDIDGYFCYSCGHQFRKKISISTQLTQISRQLEFLIANSNPEKITTSPVIDGIHNIELYPGNRSNHHHKNKVVLKGNSGKHSVHLNNACFDFLYYLCWLKDEKQNSFTIYQSMPDNHRDFIFQFHRRQNRFNAQWTTPDTKSKSHYIWQINKQLGINLIQRSGINIHIARHYSTSLYPYKKS